MHIKQAGMVVILLELWDVMMIIIANLPEYRKHCVMYNIMNKVVDVTGEKEIVPK